MQSNTWHYMSKFETALFFHTTKCMKIWRQFFFCSVPAARVHEMCPDCPTLIHHDNNNVQKTVSHSLEKFNKESGLANRFALLKICRAAAGVSLPYLQKEHQHMWHNYPVILTSITHSVKAENIVTEFLTPEISWNHTKISFLEVNLKSLSIND